MDLGTNTFHLLIAAGSAIEPEILFKTTDPVKLGEGGINKGIIQQVAFERGVRAMQQFHEQILKFDVQKTRAIATSALRSASNGQDFIDEVKAKTGIDIETINGDEEAGFIYKGVKAGGCLNDKNALIMDIGGGSIEFILGSENGILWKQSFEIGAARLMDKFHQIDPITPEAINELKAYLENKLADLFNAMKSYRIDYLIGSSGAFDTFAEVIEGDKGNPFDVKKIKKYTFNIDELISTTDHLIISSHNQRASNKNIVPIRVDMIVVSSITTRFIMQKFNISRVMLSTNSLKEGVVADMLG